MKVGSGDAYLFTPTEASVVRGSTIASEEPICVDVAESLWAAMNVWGTRYIGAHRQGLSGQATPLLEIYNGMYANPFSIAHMLLKEFLPEDDDEPHDVVAFLGPKEVAATFGAVTSSLADLLPHVPDELEEFAAYRDLVLSAVHPDDDEVTAFLELDFEVPPMDPNVVLAHRNLKIATLAGVSSTLYDLVYNPTA
jgi:hypothetical protein